MFNFVVKKTNSIMNKLKNIIKTMWRRKAEVFYLLTIAALFIQFFAFYYLVSMPFVYGVHTMSIIILSDILLVLFPMIFINGRWKWILWIPMILVTVWMMSNVWYARTYMSLMPLSSYFLFENVNSLLVASIIGSVKLVDLFLVLPVLALYGFYRKYKTEISQNTIPRIFKWAYVLFSLVVIVVSQLFYSYRCYELRFENRYNEGFADCFMACTMQRLGERSFHRMDYYMSNGFVAYILHYLSDFMPERELTKDEMQEIEQYLSDKPTYVERRCDNIGKNLIFVVVESLNSWVIDYEVAGHKVAPTLSRIFNDTTNFAVKNVVPQVCNGRSSDAHFMYNTGLLPSKDVVTAVDFGDGDYPSLAKALDEVGYSAFEVIGDNVRFGNQEITRRSYGFDEIYDLEDYCDDNVRLLDVDSVVFVNAFEKIKNASSPFYAMVVTLSMHMPYNEMANCPEWLSECDDLCFETRCYLSAVWNFDVQLSRFLSKLKDYEIYDKSVVVIASDHNGYDKCKLAIELNNDYDSYVIPFVVINGGVYGNYEDIVGQIDVFPTLLDVMGILGDYEWSGLGVSLLREPKVASAVDKNGSVVGKRRDDDVKRQINAWKISNNIITSRYFD